MLNTKSMSIKEFQPLEELKKYQPSLNSKTESFINTTCSNKMVLSKEDRKKRSSLYLNVRKIKHATSNTFTYKIEGKDIFLKKKDKLFPELWVHEKGKKVTKDFIPSIKNLIIACDVLEIHDDLILPVCNVSIFARKLIIKKKIGIYTEPLAWEGAALDSVGGKKAENGADGRNAGDVNIFAESTLGEKLTIYANGGNGQDAGKGKNGEKGKSVEAFRAKNFEYEVGIIYKCLNKCYVSFNPPATLIKYDWYHFNPDEYFAKWKDMGSREKPSNGKDGIIPGKPGEPGNGGNVCYSIRTGYVCYIKGGTSGKKAKDVTGGEAGKPIESAEYQLQMEWINEYAEERTADYSCKIIKGIKLKTEDGKSYAAPSPKSIKGKNGVYSEYKESNSWLHPVQLKIILKFARAEYLRNQSKETIKELKKILHIYLKNLNEKFPKVNIWNKKTFQVWNKSQESISALIAKIEGQKDYYNNPAGYMPLLNLNSSISLYENNLTDSIRSLVLSKWLTISYNKAEEKRKIIKSIYKNVTKEAKCLSKKSKEILAKIATVETELENVKSKLEDLKQALATVETRLINKAADIKSDEANIRFGTKLCAGLLQVIPFAQPALGVVGKVVSSISDNYEKEFSDKMKGASVILDKNDLGAVLTKTAKGLRKSKENSKNQKEAADVIGDKDYNSSDTIIAEFRRKKIQFDGTRYQQLEESVKIEERIKISGNEPVKKNESEEKVSKWSQISGNMGSAVIDIVDAFSSLSISEEEVYAAADRLKNEDSEWNKLIDEVKKFNVQKSKFFNEFIETIEAYSIVANEIQRNTVLALSLIDNMGSKCILTNDDLFDFANEIEEQTKDRLVYQLYILTKAYETTTFEQLEINWHENDNIFDMVSKLIEGKKLEDLESIVKILEPVFKKETDKVKDSILNFLTKKVLKTVKREITIVRDDHLNQLKNGSIKLDPLELGLIPPNFHFIKLKNFTELEIFFHKEKPTDPDPSIEGSDFRLALSPKGTVRVGKDLKVIRSLARVHNWASVKEKWSKDKISNSYNNLLETLIKKEKCGKLAIPPAWSMFEISLKFGDKIKNCKIKKIKLTCELEFADSDKSQRVIDIRTKNALGASIKIKGLQSEEISFIGKFYQITEFKNKIQLTTELQSNGNLFKEWEISSRSGIEKFTTAKLELNLNENKYETLYTITAVYESVKPKAYSAEELNRELRFSPQPLYPNPNIDEDPFYFVEDNNQVVEFNTNQGVPKGWAQIVTNNHTGYVKLDK